MRRASLGLNVNTKNKSNALDTTNTIDSSSSTEFKKRTSLRGLKTTNLIDNNNQNDDQHQTRQNQFHSIPSHLDRRSCLISSKISSFSTFLGSQRASSPATTETTTSSSYVTATQQISQQQQQSESSNFNLNSSSNTLSNSNSFYASARSEPDLGDNSKATAETPTDFEDSFHSFHSNLQQQAISASSSTITLGPEQQQQLSEVKMPSEEPELCLMDVSDIDSNNNNDHHHDHELDEPAQLIENLALESTSPDNNTNSNNKVKLDRDESVQYTDSECQLFDDNDDCEDQNADVGRRKQLATSLGRLAERRSSEGCSTIVNNISSNANITSIIQSATSTGSSITASQIRTLMRKNSIQMIESEKLPSVTEGVAMGRTDNKPEESGSTEAPINMQQQQQSAADLSQQQQRPSSLLMQISKQRQQRRQSSASSGSQDNVASSSNSLSISPPGSASRRRRSSTTSQSSSVLSETSRQQLQFDYSPDLPMDSSLDRANAIDTNDSMDDGDQSATGLRRPLSISRPESPEPEGSCLSLAATGPVIESEAEIEMLEDLRDGNSSSGRCSLDQQLDVSQLRHSQSSATRTAARSTSRSQTNSIIIDNNNNPIANRSSSISTTTSSGAKLTTKENVSRFGWRSSPSPSPSSLGGSSTGSTHSSSARSSNGTARKHSRDNCKPTTNTNC